MKKFFLLIAFSSLAKHYAQQVIFNDSFNNLTLQTYTTGGSTVQFTNVPSTYQLINDTLGNNIGYYTSPNKPFNEPSLKRTGWAVVYNPLENDTFLVSTSWLDTTGIAVERWVITQPITNITANSVLTWRAKSPDASYAEGYEVYGTTNTSVLVPQSFAVGDRLFGLVDGNTVDGGEKSTWTRRSVSLAAFAGLQLRFAFRDNSRDMYQLWIDDIEVLTLTNALDGALSLAPFNKYQLVGVSDSAHVTLTSLGAAAITSIAASYQIGNSSINTETFTLASPDNYGQSSLIKFAIPYSISQPGYYPMKIWLNAVNGAPDQNLFNDTLRYYVTIQNSAPARQVLVEQFTSANSVDGPDAQDKVIPLQSNSAVVVNIHQQDSLVDPTSLGLITDYKKEFGTALIDRFYFDNLQTVVVDRTYYANLANTRKSAVSPAAISIINKNYNTATRTLSFTVRADFVGEVRGDYRLNAYLTENQVYGPPADTTVNGFNQLNGMYDVPWSFYYLTGYYSQVVNAYVLNAAQYKHHNTLVHCFDGSYGSPGLIPTSGGTQGQSYQQTFTVTLPTYTTGINKFQPDNLYIVGFVAEYSADKNQRTVLNSVREKLNSNDEYVGIKEIPGNINVSLYPNPTAGELIIDTRSLSSNYKFSVFDVSGRRVVPEQGRDGGSLERVDLSGLSAGVYFVKIVSGKQSLTEKVIIRKN